MFLIRPRPFNFESLSSWRLRASIDNGFPNFPRPDQTYVRSDPDRYPGTQEIAWLAKEFFVAKEQLTSMTLDRLPIPFSGNVEPLKKMRWVLPLGLEFDHGYSGPLFCADCLRTDDTPYFRLKWRLAFLSYCPVHSTLLKERCPQCKYKVWPVSHYRTRSDAWPNLRYCLRCGFDLAGLQGEVLGSSAISKELWQLYSTGVIPAALSQASTPNEVFDALWVMCQLLLRNQSIHLWKHLPSYLTPPITLLDTTERPAAINLISFESRRLIIPAAYWLIGDWPSRFLHVASVGSISWTHMASNCLIQPAWLTAIVKQHLTLRRRDVVTICDVKKTIDELSSSTTGVTKTAVRKKLGVTESTVIDQVIWRRQHASIDELAVICKKFDDAIRTTPTARDQRVTLIRDFLIFLLSVIRAESIEVVCVLPVSAVINCLKPNSPNSLADDIVRVPFYERARELNIRYGTEVRPLLEMRTRACDAWFISRFGKIVKGHSVRERIAKMMCDGFATDLWRSADVFMHTLSGNASYGRRAQKKREA